MKEPHKKLERKNDGEGDHKHLLALSKERAPPET